MRLAHCLTLLMLLILCSGGASGQALTQGQWSPPFALPNVAIHTHVLPNGKVLFWGRREWGLDKQPREGLDPHDCTPHIWDPLTGQVTATPQPGFNLFCSGHTFLPDGRLLVVGGHRFDSVGEMHATLYNFETNTWTRIDDMSGGRWYPTAVTLPDGGALVSFGSDQNGQPNPTQQIEKDGHWKSIVTFDAPPLYPRMHVAPDGRVFMSGPLELTQYLDTSGSGKWTFLNPDFTKSCRLNGDRDYAPSVMYDAGKILFIGGGNPPTATAETLDLNAPTPVWQSTSPMRFARRQHNATLLPDGTVLVTGGTQGSGGASKGFNDLTPGQPIRAAELWNPKTGLWTVLAEEQVDRCYHSTAVLLPDGRVLSAGGGEYRPDSSNAQNDLKDSHLDAQLFSPPYLFRGTRPVILNAPTDVTYGQTFDVKISDPGQVSQVTWIRLSSVTHSFNQSQRINFLKFISNAAVLAVTAPANANLCPPGHYMLFVLNKDQVPSVAKIIRIH